MNNILILPIILSALVVLIFLPKWIKKAKEIGLVWEDMNKTSKPKVAGSGGIITVMAFVFGVLLYIAIKTFVLKTDVTSVEIFALLTTIILAALIGFIDDILGWVHGGLPAKFRIFLAFVASIPLVVINVGSSSIEIPLLGLINFGCIYSIVFVPIGVAGAIGTYNFLAGYNGLEAGQGIIILSFLSFIAYLTGNSWLALIGLCMVSALIIFYLYNKCPAKVFPGDSMTYAIGALIAGMAILGNFEKVAVFVFIPYIAEAVLKVRGRLKRDSFPWSFGIPRKDGSLDEPYKKIYGLEHLAIKILKKIKGRAYEKDVAYLIFAGQIIICLLSLIVFRRFLF